MVITNGVITTTTIAITIAITMIAVRVCLWGVAVRVVGV